MPPSRWLPLESNPEVLNNYMTMLGVTKPEMHFVDVYGVTPEMLAMVPHPVAAVMLVYPINDDSERTLKALTEAQKEEVAAFMRDHPFFYTKQYVANACGTIAILHALLNHYDALGTVEEGSLLARTYAELKDETPEKRGQAISTFGAVAAAHAVAAVQGYTTVSEDMNVYLHFVCFVKVGDRCVELDGRQANPILHGTCTDEATFLTAAAEAIQNRMSLNPKSFEFSITALVGGEE